LFFGIVAKPDRVASQQKGACRSPTSITDMDFGEFRPDVHLLDGLSRAAEQKRRAWIRLNNTRMLVFVAHLLRSWRQIGPIYLIVNLLP
jgi:hypothetical protein